MALFTKHHYEALANALHTDLPDLASSHYAELIHRLAKMLEKDNPKFNKERFMNACGVTK
jgi:hypothetical protein